MARVTPGQPFSLDLFDGEIEAVFNWEGAYHARFMFSEPEDVRQLTGSHPIEGWVSFFPGGDLLVDWHNSGDHIHEAKILDGRSPLEDEEDEQDLQDETRWIKLAADIYETI